MNLFGRKTTEISKSGVYLVSKEKLLPLQELPKSGSLNDIAESLGYKSDEFHLVLTHDAKKTEYICFPLINNGKVIEFKNPIFTGVKDKTCSLTYKELMDDSCTIDFLFEFDSIQ